MRESKIVCVENSYFITRPYPKIFMFVFKHVGNKIIGKRIGIIAFISEREKVIVIIALKAINCSKPHISFVILNNAIHNICYKSVACAEVGKSILLRGLCKVFYAKQQANSKESKTLQNKKIDPLKYRPHQAHLKISLALL